MDANVLLWGTFFILSLSLGLMVFYYSKLKSVSKREKKLLLQERERGSRDALSSTYPEIKQKEIDITETIEADNEVLNTSESLIEFLRLKSKKIEIRKEKFNLNNVLNEVSGSLVADYSGKNISLIYDIDKSVPRYLTGDSLHLGQIIISLIKSSIENGWGREVKLEISDSGVSTLGNLLQFRIMDMSTKLLDKKEKLLSMPHYDDEKGTYVGLDLFVANELVILMHGKLYVEVLADKGAVYILELPFSADDWVERRQYRLPNKTMLGKSILVCDENDTAASALKKMFQYFKCEVTTISFEIFSKKRIDMSKFNMVVLDEKLLTHPVSRYLETLKKQKNLKVIGLHNIFSDRYTKNKNTIIDKYLSNPLSQENVYEAIIDIYEKDKNPPLETTENSIDNTTPAIQIYKGHFEEKANVSTKSFADFNGKTLLIVEDNIINQKILTNVLAHSGMHISVANNGQEALEILFDKEKKFDLVLMDINMPIMDGYTATSSIREKIEFASLPIVALTALVLESEITKMFDRGISGYLSKPLKIGKLYTAFAYFLERNDGEQTKLLDSPTQVSELEGIDIKQGIVYADGNEALYREVLSEFLSAYGATDSLLRNLVDQEKDSEIKMLSADMRSLTKTIGAYKMHDLSDRMYKLFLYNNQHMVPKYVEEYGQELARLRASIQSYIAR